MSCTMLPVNQLAANRIRFTVWAPEKEQMNLHIVAPADSIHAMDKDEWGYFSAEVATNGEALQYYYQPEGRQDFPDPGSMYQPEGVHGPSQTIDHSRFAWADAGWKGLELGQMVIYELHVGSFTPEGSFEAIIPRLDSLKELGINALEIMPVAQFPGSRNWGYDGVYPYAVQNSYGGPDGLKKLVNACHQKGIAVLLDVVYNHLGPEGNYLAQFGPYFTTKYCTPWGDALNFDGDWSDGVRAYFANNVVYWLEHFHIDGLRCDAIHMVYDTGAVHFWELVHQKVKTLEQQVGRAFHLIAESDLNSPRVVQPPAQGGYGFDGQWLDDFHHALYVLINPGDRERYYDFGTIEQLAKAYKDGFVHSGEWVRFRKRKHGASSAGVPGNRFVAFNLNHDQVGNRAGGERLCMLVNFDRVKLAAAALLLSPYVPLLFMGEEYGDNTPFFYFVSHSEEALIAAVRKGRKEEFRDYGFDVEVPDPQDEATFTRSKIHWELRTEQDHRTILAWHRELIRLRSTLSSLQNFSKEDVDVHIINPHALALERRSNDCSERLLCLFNFGTAPADFMIPGHWAACEKLLDAKDAAWRQHNAPGAPNHSGQVQPGAATRVHALSTVVYALKS